MGEELMGQGEELMGQGLGAVLKQGPNCALLGTQSPEFPPPRYGQIFVPSMRQSVNLFGFLTRKDPVITLTLSLI